MCWTSLWQTLAAQGVSQHLICAIQSIYENQTGFVRGSTSSSSVFSISAGVRQGCILSPRLFAAVLEFVISDWKQRNNFGLDIGDADRKLLELRFADDVLLFASSVAEAANILDSLVIALRGAGLILNAEKTIVLTNQAQAPQQLETANGMSVKILDRHLSHKWLGCYLLPGGKWSAVA